MAAPHYKFSLETTIPTPDSGNRFGRPTRVGSDKVLVSVMPKAYLFDLRGNLLTTFTNPAPAEWDSFGLGVEALGHDRVIVQAMEAVYLFDLTGHLLQTFRPPGSGYIRVAPVGTSHLVMGEARLGLPQANVVYVFNTNAVLVNTITNPTPDPREQFGAGVTGVGADKVLVYEPLERSSQDPASGDCSECQPVFYLMHTDGTHVATIKPPFNYFHDEYVLMTAAGPDQIMVGGYQSGRGYENAAVFLFDTAGTLLTTWTNPAPGFGLAELFGASGDSLDAERYVISVHGSADDYTSGRVYLFGKNGDVLGELSAPKFSNEFGGTVDAVGDDRVIVGDWDVVYIYRVHPVLSARSSTTNSLLLSWPASAIGYILEESGSVGDANWSEVPHEPLVLNDQKEIVISLPSPSRFYRLRKNLLGQ